MTHTLDWTLAITCLGITWIGYNTVEVMDPNLPGLTKAG